MDQGADGELCGGTKEKAGAQGLVLGEEGEPKIPRTPDGGQRGAARSAWRRRASAPCRHPSADFSRCGGH